MNRLKDKTALVIGAHTGIGREVARLFAEEGAAVAIADFGRKEEGKSLMELLDRSGALSLSLEVNVLDESQVKEIIERTIQEFGHLDIIVNNAGISGPQSPIQDVDIDAFEEVMGVNLRGVFFGMKHALPHMIERGYGRIINTASQLAHKPSPLNAPYCASKAGVVALTCGVAHEVAGRGITVNCVCPGPTDTVMWRTDTDEEWKRWKIDSLPMKRLGTAEEIAWAYVYLASDEASFLYRAEHFPQRW